jgi:transcriptional regulator with XRE-family HTH domain
LAALDIVRILTIKERMLMISYGYDIAKIAQTRTARGLTMGALAKLADIHPATVASVLKGISGTPTTIAKIAKALEIDLADITIPIEEPAEVLKR